MGLAWYNEIAGEWAPPPPPPGTTTEARRPHWLPLVLSRHDVQRLLQAPNLSSLEQLVLRVLYGSGMRVEELVALKAEGLAFQSHSVALPSRLVLLDAETIQALLDLDWEQWCWSVESVTEILRRAAHSCEIGARFAAMGRTLLPKTLRHAFAAHRLERGMDLFSLHKLLGHEYFDTTEMITELAVGCWKDQYDSCHPLAQKFKLASFHYHPTRSQASPGELEILELLRATESVRDALILRTLYAAGLRVSELTGLLWADLELEERRLFIREAKEDKDRYSLIDHDTARLLRSRRKGKALGEVVFDISERQINRIVKNAGRRTGLLEKYAAEGKTLSPHALRHAHASHLYQHGMELYTIRKLLGHAALETTLIYVDCELPQWQAAYARSSSV